MFVGLHDCLIASVVPGAEEEEDYQGEAEEAEKGDEGEVFVVGIERIFLHGGIGGDEFVV